MVMVVAVVVAAVKFVVVIVKAGYTANLGPDF